VKKNLVNLLQVRFHPCYFPSQLQPSRKTISILQYFKAFIDRNKDVNEIIGDIITRARREISYNPETREWVIPNTTS
jgi:hypothetical protein